MYSERGKRATTTRAAQRRDTRRRGGVRRSCVSQRPRKRGSKERIRREGGMCKSRAANAYSVVRVRERDTITLSPSRRSCSVRLSKRSGEENARQDKTQPLLSKYTLDSRDSAVTSGSSHAPTQGILPSSRVLSICTSRAFRLLRILDGVH